MIVSAGFTHELEVPDFHKFSKNIFVYGHLYESPDAADSSWEDFCSFYRIRTMMYWEGREIVEKMRTSWKIPLTHTLYLLRHANILPILPAFLGGI